MSRILINLVDPALAAASQTVMGQTQVVVGTPADCAMSDGVRAVRPARAAALGAAPFLTPGVLRARPRGPVDTKVVARAHAAPIGLGAGARPYTPDFLRLGFVVRTRSEEPVAQAPQNNLDYFVNTHRERGTLRVLNPQAQVLAVYRQALTVLGLDPNQFQLHVVEDADPGAFWVTGTRAVFVTTGLLKKPNLTAGELAWVLNHELGHFLKHRPGLAVPERFKNPLFRRYAMETHAALGQAEEYDADELGFIITDAMGFSIDEGLSMARWLSGFDRKAAAAHTTGARVLTPGKTHPYSHHRVARLEAVVANPCFVWRNRGVVATPLPFSSGDFVAHPKPTRRVFYVRSEALKIGVLAKIAAHPRPNAKKYPDLDSLVFDETNIRFFLFDSLNREKIAAENEARDMIQELRRAANEGDLIARAYLDALLTKLYLDTLKGGPLAVQQRLEWFWAHCGLSADEVLFALVGCYESHGAFLHDLIKAKNNTYDHQYFFSKYAMPSKGFSLLAVVKAFPHSALRDRFIFTLLNYRGLIANRSRFIEMHVDYRLPVPLNDHVITFAGFTELVPMFYNTSFCQISDAELIAKFMDETGQKRLREDFGDFSFEDSNLEYFFDYVYFTAGPYDRGKLEAALAEFTGYQFEHSWFGQNGVLYFFFLFMERAEKFQGFARERVLGFVCVVALRLLEGIPVQEWEPNTIAFVERMPASSERNHLLLLLDEAGVRVAKPQELVFRDIPSPEQAGSASDQISFLHAFGFIGTGQGEVIYPSGQRLLDRHVAKTWPQAGDLVFADVVHTIPRASPIRDEYLDRCPVVDAGEARHVLDAYWSPQAAYARAFEICTAWIAALPAEDPRVLDDIYRVTDEFPSLRRRMIHNWIDRFGIAATEYSRHITATQSCDAMDLYSGAVAGHAGQMSMEGRIAVCVASFSSALVRDGSFSLLSIVDEGTSGISRTTSSRGDKNEDGDEGLAGLVEDDTDDSDAVTIDDKVEIEKDFFVNFYAVMPERALELAALLTHGNVLRVQRIPFVEGKPAADRRFKKSRLAREAGKKLQEWQGTRAFGRFMRALGWKEAVVFYEGFFLGKEGILSRPSVATEVEKIFLEGIALLLQDKLVPLARVENVAQSLALFLAHQTPEMRGKIWARILAGIAQEQSLGEIVREAVRPLGAAAGGKLMQAVHSLTVGVDETLEAATRLSLDQVAAFDLFDALRFLGARGFNPFERHERVTLLGQGSVRAAIAGRGGESPEAAYLLVHAGPADPLVVRAVAQFIYRLTRDGQYFPLTATQFQSLVRQTDAERLRGFELHREFGELHGWRLGSVGIPRIEEIFGDWARVELVRGRAFSSLPPDVQVARASRILEGAVAQLRNTRSDGSFFINPEWHGGNVLSDEETNTDSLVDCGLVGAALLMDVLTLPQIHAAFAKHGLAGVVALLIKNQGFQNLSGLENRKRDDLISPLRVFAAQLAAGTAPELLLAGLVETVQRSTGMPMSPGLDVLFRATQHLSPYARLVPGGGALSGMLTAEPPMDLGKLPSEIERALKGENPAPTQTRSLPKGIAIGRVMSDGKIVSSGMLTAGCDLDKVPTEGDMAGMVPCQLAAGRQYVRPENLRIEVHADGKTRWVTVAEWLEIQSRRR